MTNETSTESRLNEMIEEPMTSAQENQAEPEITVVRPPGVIETKNMYVFYGDFMAVADVSLNFGKNEISALIGFLASDGAGYITGQNLRVDGGITRHV